MKCRCTIWWGSSYFSYTILEKISPSHILFKVLAFWELCFYSLLDGFNQPLKLKRWVESERSALLSVRAFWLTISFHSLHANIERNTSTVSSRFRIFCIKSWGKEHKSNFFAWPSSRITVTLGITYKTAQSKRPAYKENSWQEEHPQWSLPLFWGNLHKELDELRRTLLEPFS